jgi:sugar lactone lactonase YvrE
MPGSARPRTTHRPRSIVLAVTVGLVVTTVPPAQAGSSDVIVLPGAGSAEGIARGEGDTFYAGDLFAGDIFRGDLEDRTAKRFIDLPDGQRQAVGMTTDLRHDLLFVAGGATGQAYVYDLDSGETVATYQFHPPFEALINDVTLTRDGAWFTNSLAGELFLIPVGRHGELGEFRTLPLAGPAGGITGDFNLNGIAAVRHGRTLIVAHSGDGRLYTVDPDTGESAEIAGVDVPGVDGIVVKNRRVWAVQGMLDQVSEWRLDRRLTEGTLQEVISDDDLQFPSTAIHFDGRLAVVNAKFDTGFPPTAEQYEVVLVDD